MVEGNARAVKIMTIMIELVGSAENFFIKIDTLRVKQNVIPL